MKLKDGLIVSEIDGRIIAVDGGSGGQRFNGLFRMNQTAGFIAGLLRKETNMDEIVKAMTEKYDVAETVAKENAQKVIDAFRSAGLLEGTI